MSGKRVDIITTWAEAAEALGVSYKVIKSMQADCANSELPMPIEVRGRRILTTTAQLQEWSDERAARAAQGKKVGRDEKG